MEIEIQYLVQRTYTAKFRTRARYEGPCTRVSDLKAGPVSSRPLLKASEGVRRSGESFERPALPFRYRRGWQFLDDVGRGLEVFLQPYAAIFSV